MVRLKKYFIIFQLSARHTLKNYHALIGLSIFMITCLIIFSNLWKIAAAKVGALSFDPDQLLWYIALNEWVIISLPDIQETMEDDLHTGKLSYLLPRPISYLGATFAEALGALFINLTVLGVVALLYLWFTVGAFPFAAWGFIPLLLFGFLAGILGTIFHMLIGLSAFWLREVTPVHWVWEKFLLLLGGLMLPLTAYPQWMQTLAYFTPFPLILGGRSALVIDLNLVSVFQLLFLFAFWIALGAFCLLSAYRSGMRILNIEGG